MWIIDRRYFSRRYFGKANASGSGLAGDYGYNCPVTRLLLRLSDVLFVPTAPRK